MGSSLKGMAQGALDHIQETTVQNIKKFPEELIDSGRKLFRIAQTLEDYHITGKVTKKELLDALEGFHNNRLQNIENGISERLLLAMDSQNLPINVEKIEKLYDEIQAIENDPELTPEQKKEKRLALLDVIDLRGLNKALQKINESLDLSPEEKKQKRKEIREELATKKEKLTTQDILSLEIYNYIITFWITHIKDGNNIESLILEDLQKPRPQKPNNEPPKPQESDFQNKEDYEQAMINYENKIIQRKKTPEYKARNEWNGKIQWMTAVTKSISDRGPANELRTGLVQHISAILERSLGVGFQHIVGLKWRPNILEIPKEEEDLIENILLDVQRGKKVFIFLNHETFANIPIAIIKFMQVAHKKDIDIPNVNKYFTTIIGPLLATHRKQKLALNLISNILVTHPADNRIPGAKRIATLHQQIAKDQLEKDLTEESSGGQIYFCAPTGTRDIVQYLDNGEEQILMPDDTRGSTVVTCNMVKALHAKNPDLRVFTMSTNTTDLKRPDLEELQKIQNNNKLSDEEKEEELKKLRSPNNNEWKKNGTVTMHIEEIKLKDFSKEDMFFGIQKTLKNDLFKEKVKGDSDYNKIKEVLRATQEDSEIAFKSIFELINEIIKTTNNLKLLEIIYPLWECLGIIQQTSELISFEYILGQTNNAIEIAKDDPKMIEIVSNIKEAIERIQQNSNVILDCTLNLSDRAIEIVKNDPELLEIASKYIIDKNLSPKHINKTLVKNTTHAIPSSKQHKPSKNPIKRHRNKGKKYYDLDVNGRIKEVQCAETLPPQAFKSLKKETKTKQYAYTGHLPEKYQRDGKIDTEIVKSETEKAYQNNQ